jgi:CRISPR system Cascade subunit CasD
VLSNSIKMGVRADRTGTMLEDFHTVTGERGFLFTAGGKKRVGGATIITPRQYIQDACFTVALTAEGNILRECAYALQNPIWPIYLGRKCCVPSAPVYVTVTDEYSSIIQALSNYPLCERHDTDKKYLCEYEDITGSILRRDAVLINDNRNYGYRRIKISTVDIEGGI